MVGDKLCNFIALYRTPSQLQDQFEFIEEHLYKNIFDSYIWTFCSELNVVCTGHIK